jgi:hypothetical protein
LLSYRRPGQTLRDNERIVPERIEQFAQYLRLLCVLRHAIHLSLQLLGGDWPLPVILQRLRLAQVIFNFRFQLGLRHHRIERWLQIVTLAATAGPDAVTPVNVLDRSLIRHSVSEC